MSPEITLRLEELIKKLRRKFIVFDGPDGCGKSTIREWLTTSMTDLKMPVITVREPGGTGYGEAIRDVLLHRKITGEHLDPSAEMLLFMAARMQLMQKVIKPALDSGNAVLSDRFVSSTLAYQCEGLGVPWDDTLNLAKLVIPAEYWPACTVILDAPQAVLNSRLSSKSTDRDRIESRTDEFRERVRFGYLKQAVLYPHHVILVDASGTVEETKSNIVTGLSRFFREKI